MSDIPKEYVVNNDFGFTAVDDPLSSTPVPDLPVANEIYEILDKLSKIQSNIVDIENKLDVHPKLNQEEVNTRLREVEQLIMPLLVNLGKNPEKEYILWPKRTDQINGFIEKLLKLTRS